MSSVAAILGLVVLLLGPLLQIDVPTAQTSATPAPPPGASAPPAGLQLSAQAGLNGTARIGSWIPVDVELANQGEDLSGEVQVRVEDARRQGVYGRAPTVYSLPVDLPTRSHKRLAMDVLFPSTANSLQASFVVGGKAVATQDVGLTRIGLGDFFCGVLSRQPHSFDFLSSLDLSGPQRRVRLAPLDPATVPDRAQLLSSLDCIIVQDAQSAALSARQIEALRVWVAAGGLFIAVGGPSWQRTLGALPDDLLAVKPTELATVNSLHGLVDLVGQAPSAPGPWLLSRGRANGMVVAQQDGIPLVVGRHQGQGMTFYLGFDPTVQALASWRGGPFVWRYLLAHASVDAGIGTTLARPYMRWGRLPRAALGDFGALPQPDLDWLLWLLLGYAVLVGPGALLLTRRLGRPLLGLALVPGLALATTLVLGGLFAAQRTSDLAATKATVIRAVGGGLGFARTYAGVYARHGGSYALDVPNGGLLFGLYYPFPMHSYTDTPDWWLHVSEGAQTRLDDLQLADGALATFALDQQVDLGGQVDDALVADHDQIVGTVTNHFSQPIRAAAVLLDVQTVYPIGDLAPGESRSVSFQVPDRAALGYGVPTGLASQIYPGWKSDRDEDSARRDLVESIFSSRYYAARMDVSGPMLVGWLDQNPAHLGANGAELPSVDYTLLVSPLQIALPPNYEGELSAGLMTRQHLTVAPVGQQDFGSYTLAPGESVSVQFTLPVRPERLDVEALTVHLEASTAGRLPGNAVGHLSLFDWKAGNWRDWEAHFGDTLLDDPQRFISAGGDIRLRYTFDPPPDLNMSQIRLGRFDVSGQVRAL